MPPPDSLNRLAAMQTFCKMVDYIMRTEGAKYRWCFSNLELAKWFKTEFGGEFFDLSHGPSLKS